MLFPGLIRSGCYVLHLFIDFRTPRPNRYRHQDYPSRMFLAKQKKNNENSALGPFQLCAARGRVT